MEIQIAAPKGAVRDRLVHRSSGLLSRHAEIRLEERTLLSADALQNLEDRGLVLDIRPTRDTCGLSVVYDLQHREFVPLIRSIETGLVITALSMPLVAGTSLGASLWRAADDLEALAKKTGERLYDINFASDGSWSRLNFKVKAYFVDTSNPLSNRRSKWLTSLRRDEIEFSIGDDEARIRDSGAAEMLADLIAEQARECGPSYALSDLMIVDRHKRPHALSPPSGLDVFDVDAAVRTLRWRDPAPEIQ